MWYKNVGTHFFRFITIHAFDRQTERPTDGRTDEETDRHTCKNKKKQIKL